MRYSCPVNQAVISPKELEKNCFHLSLKMEGIDEVWRLAANDSQSTNETAQPPQRGCTSASPSTKVKNSRCAAPPRLVFAAVGEKPVAAGGGREAAKDLEAGGEQAEMSMCHENEVAGPPRRASFCGRRGSCHVTLTSHHLSLGNEEQQVRVCFGERTNAPCALPSTTPPSIIARQAFPVRSPAFHGC